MKRLLTFLLVALFPTVGWGQASVLQGGSFTSGLAPMYSTSSGQPTIQQSGTAAGGAQSLKEMSIVARGSGTAPYVGSGGGYLGSRFCMYDAPSANSTGGHQLCLDPNATGGFGLLSYNSFGGAAAKDLKFVVNGTTYPFPFTQGSVSGPGSSTVGHIATWANTSGTLLADGGVALAIGGSSGQIQYNNAGALGGFTLGGDATVVVSTGNMTITKIGGNSVALGGFLHTDGSVTFSGASSATLTVSGATSITLPTTGTLATLAGSEALTNKTYNGLTVNSTTGTLAVTNGKVLTASSTLTFTGTDGSTLNVGTGGTLGTAAYTAATAYLPSGVQITNSLSGDVSLSNTGSYFTGPSVAQGSTGTWWCSGAVAVLDTAAGATFSAKLWDGTTVASSMAVDTTAANKIGIIALSGYVASPAGNMRISVKDGTATTGAIKFNSSGNSKDATLSCFRVA